MCVVRIRVPPNQQRLESVAGWCVNIWGGGGGRTPTHSNRPACRTPGRARSRWAGGYGLPNVDIGRRNRPPPEGSGGNHPGPRQCARERAGIDIPAVAPAPPWGRKPRPDPGGTVSRLAPPQCPQRVPRYNRGWGWNKWYGGEHTHPRGGGSARPHAAPEQKALRVGYANSTPARVPFTSGQAGAPGPRSVPITSKREEDTPWEQTKRARPIKAGPGLKWSYPSPPGRISAWAGST